MRMRILAIASSVAVVFGLGFTMSVVRADEGCKEGCCEGADKGHAKKDEKKDAKGGSCEGCGEKTSKAIKCDDCDKSTTGPCAKCKDFVAKGKAWFIPVKGMTCEGCEGAVGKKMEPIEGVGHYFVTSKKNGMAVIAAPGKAVKVSEIEKAFAGTKFSIDDSANLYGKFALVLSCADCDKKDCGDAFKKAFGGLKGAEVTPGTCDETAKECHVTLMLGDKSEVSLKQIRDGIASTKLKLSDVVMCGGCCEGEKEKCDKDAKGKS